MADKSHKVEVIMEGERWVAAELNGKVSFHRGGTQIGVARWMEDEEQFAGMSTTAVPDNVVTRLERELAKRIKEERYKD